MSGEQKDRAVVEDSLSVPAVISIKLEDGNSILVGGGQLKAGDKFLFPNIEPRQDRHQNRSATENFGRKHKQIAEGHCEVTAGSLWVYR